MDIFDKYDGLRREKDELDRVIEKLCRAYVFDSNSTSTKFIVLHLFFFFLNGSIEFLIRVPI